MDQLKTAIREKGIAVEELRQYSYDTNRNQTDIKNTKTGEDQTYVYDAENRLSQVSVTKDGKTAVIQQNIYNGEGQRIQKVDGDETTNYYYQDGVVAYTTDANGEQNSQNLIGTDGNVLATERFQQNATQYYLYNKDIQGSTSSLVKEDRSADATYQYTDFGETTIQGDDQAKNEVCYTGGIYDQSTELYYLNARYYNPEDGRFMTENSYRGEIMNPETGHLYVYCANNPVNYADPSGHFAAAMYTVIKLVLVGGANIFMIYELKFSYYEDNSENNDEIIIAVYSSYKKAEIGKKKFSQQPRFKGKEEFLEINEYKINEAEWNEGFWRATKSYFIIKLLNNYMIEKEEEYNPENHDIEVKYGENIKVYNGKMDYYYDHEKFLCLKNTENGQMYCLDKQQRKILYKIDKYEDMLKFLNQKYEIENFGWKNIFRE